jgi:hypothetical protein
MHQQHSNKWLMDNRNVDINKMIENQMIKNIITILKIKYD